MSEELFREFLSQFAQEATKKLAEKAAGEVVNSLFSNQTSTYPYKGRVEKIWIDSNIQINNRKGLLIHSNFQVGKLKDVKCRAAAYFYFGSGTALKDINASYRSADGQVAVGEDFIPPYDETVYKDFRLFIPYDELHLAEGKHDLKFFIRLYEQSKDIEVARSNEYHFRHTYFDNEPKAEFRKISVDFDTTESGMLGMRIHLNFQIDNLKGSQCQATAFFYSNDDGEKPLKDCNRNYCSTDGQVCVSSDFTPGHKNTVYEDLSLFIPYKELHLQEDQGLEFRVRLLNKSKNMDIAWADSYCFLMFPNEGVTIGEEEVVDTVSMVQVLIARHLGVDVADISPEATLTHLLGNRFSNTKKMIEIVERNFNIKFDYSDADEVGFLAELDSVEELAFIVICKRNQQQLSQNSASKPAQPESVTTTSCPKCSQKLRAPDNRGKLTLTCPKCKHSWQWTPMEAFNTYREYIAWFKGSGLSSQPLSEPEFYRSVRYKK